ncbi:MAG: hypothetical protein EOP11_04415 [Proteobacteria bacterium]|nr:MAG: hypothetical protein EOP11_04415 [Pseudomonadota bacterium]
MKRALIFLFALPLLVLAAWGGAGAYLAATQPSVRIERVSAASVSGEKTLPFYELMSPVPALEASDLLPKLEYKKGPPTRYIERMSLLVRNGASSARERIIYHGRRTRDDLAGLKFFAGDEPSAEARYVEAAILASQGQDTKIPAWKFYLLRPLLLREASLHLANVEEVQIMEQAGIPAFLFLGRRGAAGDVKASSLFVRRNSFYRVDYLGSQGFQTLQPSELFRKSFLVDKRGDAMDYLGRNLIDVRLEQAKIADAAKIEWPLLLLAAKVSVDPASLETYFHFAGISALLFRSVAMDGADTETLDILRNNVLAAEFYARDIAPQAPKTAEIGRLARQLTRNLE